MNSESQAKPEIYAFINARMKGDIEDVVSIALAEDGELLAQHISSNETWAQYDMGIYGDRNHDKYQEHYPFEVMATRDCVPGEDWAMLWAQAEENGLGTSRSMGFGRFTMLAWERIN